MLSVAEAHTIRSNCIRSSETLLPLKCEHQTMAKNIVIYGLQQNIWKLKMKCSAKVLSLKWMKWQLGAYVIYTLCAKLSFPQFRMQNSLWWEMEREQMDERNSWYGDTAYSTWINQLRTSYSRQRCNPCMNIVSLDLCSCCYDVLCRFMCIEAAVQLHHFYLFPFLRFSYFSFNENLCKSLFKDYLLCWSFGIDW